MDELDAELLALAGNPAAVSPPATSKGKKRSEPPMSASPPKSKKSKSGSAKKTANKKSRRDYSDDDDDHVAGEDEDSALSSAPESEASEPEETSRPAATRPANAYPSSSDESEEDGIFELYPFEGTYKDAADKARLMAMNEFAREAVLAERVAEIERAMQDRHLRTLLKSQSRNIATAGANAAAAAAATANSDGDSVGGGITRRSTRNQAMQKPDSKKGKLDEMKRAREERGARKDKPTSATAEEDTGRKRSMSVSSDDQVEYANDHYEVKKQEREIEVQDINRARIGRTGFSKLCDYPGFDEKVIECFVRVSLFDRETGQNVYRVAQIKGITQGKPYSLLDGKRRTDKHLLLVQGKSERSFKMDQMSDRPITESEFNRFKAQLNVDMVPLPTLSVVRRKAEDLRVLDSRTFTAAEVSEMIAKRNKDRVDLVASAIERSRLKQLREEAYMIGDTNEVNRIDKEIEALDDYERRSSLNVQLQTDAIVRHNAESRRKNRVEVRAAEIEERRERLMKRKWVKTGKVKRGMENMADPFKGKDFVLETVDDQPVNGDQEKKGEETTEAALVMQKKGKKKDVDDVIADLGIDLDIDLEI